MKIAEVQYGDQIRWIIGFAVGCSVLVGVGLLILWALTGFADLGVSGHGLAALILGTVFSMGLGTALMALIFYSNRSGYDEDVHQTDADVERDAKET